MCPPSATARHCRGPGPADSCRSRAPPTAAWSLGGLGLMPRERLADLGEQIVAHHVVAEIDRTGEAFGVGAAVALDDDAVETEEDATVRLARIHLVAERAEGAARQQVAEPGRQRAAHLALEDLAELAGGALGRLERDIAGKTFGHHHVHRPLADVVALDEA